MHLLQFIKVASYIYTTASWLTLGACVKVIVVVPVCVSVCVCVNLVMLIILLSVGLSGSLILFMLPIILFCNSYKFPLLFYQHANYFPDLLFSFSNPHLLVHNEKLIVTYTR